MTTTTAAQRELGSRSSDVAIGMRSITKHFGSMTANSKVDFDVKWGEVHALLGENGAGKTTLMRMATGMYQPDGGDIVIDGVVTRLRRPEDALELGIGMVHQHFTLVPTLTAAENIALSPSFWPTRLDMSTLCSEIEKTAAELGFSLDPKKRVSDATISERQRIEIIKLVHRGADILIFDEPSAALTPTEWTDLAHLMRTLAAAGKAIILISHKLDEVFAVADHWTVLRGGAVVGSGGIADTTQNELIELMVGEAVTLRPDRPVIEVGLPVLQIRDLVVPRPASAGSSRPLLDDLSLEVCGAEIVGIAGVAGNGQSELVETLLGLCTPTGGTIMMNGKFIDKATPRGFADNGGALIPEDRHTAAVADELTIWENLLMRDAVAAPLSSHGFIRRRAVKRRATELMREYDVRATGPDARVGQLSGGNQQKVVVAREMSREPSLVVAVQPTRGLDVRASEFVYRKLNECKERGGAVLLISMDLEEVIAMSDRVAVIASGRIQGILDNSEATHESIGALMTGGKAR